MYWNIFMLWKCWWLLVLLFLSLDKVKVSSCFGIWGLEPHSPHPFSVDLVRIVRKIIFDCLLQNVSILEYIGDRKFLIVWNLSIWHLAFRKPLLLLLQDLSHKIWSTITEFWQTDVHYTSIMLHQSISIKLTACSQVII